MSKDKTRGEIDVKEELRLGTNHLVIIGIDNYHSSLPSLNNAVSDAQIVKKEILKNYQFEEAFCYEFINQDATRESISDLFDRLADLLTESDNLVIYFAGHGMYYKEMEKGYWLLSDAKKGKRTSYFCDSEVLGFIKRLRAKHVFAMIDSCFSGSLFRSIGELESTRKYRIKSRYVMTSGRIEPVKDGPPGHHSPFCVEVLKEMRTTEKNVQWVGDLCRAVCNRVDNGKDGQLALAEPMRNLGHEGGEYAFLSKGSKVRNLETIEKHKTIKKGEGKEKVEDNGPEHSPIDNNGRERAQNNIDVKKNKGGFHFYQ